MVLRTLLTILKIIADYDNDDVEAVDYYAKKEHSQRSCSWLPCWSEVNDWRVNIYEFSSGVQAANFANQPTGY